jgi:hypothetical protein
VALRTAAAKESLDLGEGLYVELIGARVERCEDAIGVAADRAIFDVFLMLTAAGVRAGVYETAAVGAPVLAEHWQFMVLAAKMRYPTDPHLAKRGQDTMKLRDTACDLSHRTARNQ